MGQLEKPKRDSSQPDWITIFLTHDLQEAHIIAGKLQTYDIQSMILTVPGASALGITLGNLGEIKVLVHSEVYDRAYDILFPDEQNLIEDSTDYLSYHLQDDGEDGEYYLDEDDDE